MKIYQPLGIFLILAGIFMIIMQPFTPITGAIIDVSTTLTRTWALVGLISIGIGTALLVLQEKKARK